RSCLRPPATTEIYPPSLHDALPILELRLFTNRNMTVAVIAMALFALAFFGASLLFPQYFQYAHGETPLKAGLLLAPQGIGAMVTDRKSTRLNSSHVKISYAVFCLKK